MKLPYLLLICSFAWGCTGKDKDVDTGTTDVDTVDYTTTDTTGTDTDVGRDTADTGKPTYPSGG